jgi:hypothetical protein
MSGFKDSEAYAGLLELAGKYKKFAFDIFQKVPYHRVGVWIAFAEGRVEDALKDRRSVAQNIKDTYVLTVLSYIASFVSAWYMWALIGALLLLLGGVIGIAGLMTNPVMTIAVAAALILFLIISPAIAAIAHAVFYHIVMKVFGAKGSFSDTLTVLVLASGAHIALAIPIYIANALIVGLLISPLAYVVIAYVIYLTYRGMKHVHGMEAKNAAIATVFAYLGLTAALVALYISAYAAALLLRYVH